MIRPIVAAGGIALALAVSPVSAQQSPSPDKPAAQQVDPSIVGLSVYSSDGQKVGQVSEVGTSAGEPAHDPLRDNLLAHRNWSITPQSCLRSSLPSAGRTTRDARDRGSGTCGG